MLGRVSKKEITSANWGLVAVVNNLELEYRQRRATSGCGQLLGLEEKTGEKGKYSFRYLAPSSRGIRLSPTLQVQSDLIIPSARF